MQTVEVDIPEELLTLLKRSRLGDRPVPEQVRVALAIHLFKRASFQPVRLLLSRASPAPPLSFSWRRWGYPLFATMSRITSRTVRPSSVRVRSSDEGPASAVFL